MQYGSLQAKGTKSTSFLTIRKSTSFITHKERSGLSIQSFDLKLLGIRQLVCLLDAVAHMR